MELAIHDEAEMDEEIDLLGCSYDFYVLLVEPILDEEVD